MLALNNPEEERKLQQYMKANGLQYGGGAMENLRHGWMAKAQEIEMGQPVGCCIQTSSGVRHTFASIQYRKDTEATAKRLNQKFVLLYE